MSIAEQSCAQAPSAAILRHDKLSRIICRGEQCSPVLRICCKFRIVGGEFFAAEPCCCRGLITSTGEQRSPLHIHRADMASTAKHPPTGTLTDQHSWQSHHTTTDRSLVFLWALPQSFSLNHCQASLRLCGMGLCSACPW